MSSLEFEDDNILTLRSSTGAAQAHTKKQSSAGCRYGHADSRTRQLSRKQEDSDSILQSEFHRGRCFPSLLITTDLFNFFGAIHILRPALYFLWFLCRGHRFWRAARSEGRNHEYSRASFILNRDHHHQPVNRLVRDRRLVSEIIFSPSQRCVSS